MPPACSEQRGALFTQHSRREGSLEGHIPPLSKARWTADTERAFLLALRLTGQAKAAAVEIGRTPGAVYARRANNPDFKRDWDAVIAAQQAGWIAALHRAVEGWQEPIVRGGQVVAQRWRFSEGPLRDLLRAEIGKGAGGGGAAERGYPEATQPSGRAAEAQDGRGLGPVAVERDRSGGGAAARGAGG